MGAGAVYAFTVFVSGMNLCGGAGGPDNGTQAMLLTVESFCDTLFFFWTFKALGQTVQDLVSSKEEHKIGLLRWFTRVLITLGLASFVLAFYEAHWMANALWRTRWEETWFLMTGSWDCAFLVTLSAILWLWRPTDRSSLYMFYNQFDGDAQQVDGWLSGGMSDVDLGKTHEIGDFNLDDIGSDFEESTGRPLSSVPAPLSASPKGSDYDSGESYLKAMESPRKKRSKLLGLFPKPRKTYKLQKL